MRITSYFMLITFVVVIAITIAEYSMPLHDISYKEGKIDSVSISRLHTLYNFEDESFEVLYMPDEVQLHTLCRVHYGTSFLFQEVKFISIEYL